MLFLCVDWLTVLSGSLSQLCGPIAVNDRAVSFQFHAPRSYRVTSCSRRSRDTPRGRTLRPIHMSLEKRRLDRWGLRSSWRAARDLRNDGTAQRLRLSFCGVQTAPIFNRFKARQERYALGAPPLDALAFRHVD
jgi:hypothetical protein